jgi:hypothetical protein
MQHPAELRSTLLSCTTPCELCCTLTVLPTVPLCIFLNARMPDAGCRNTDAGGIRLDAEAQLWVQAINVLAEAVSVLVEAIRMLVRSPANLEALYRVPACPPIYNT